MTKIHREYDLKSFFITSLILQFQKFLFKASSNTVDSKLLEILPQDTKTNTETPKEVERLTQKRIIYV